MKILVTGAAGFIGSHVAIELARRGHEVVAADMFMDRLYSNDQKLRNWDALGQVRGIERFVVDLRHDLRGLPGGFDAVVNEAGMPGLMTSWSEFDSYLTCNIKVVENLISNVVTPETHFVQISTSSVYGLEATGAEDSPLKPTSPYGVTKLAAEELVRTYSRTQGLQHTILRYFSVFGPGQRPDMAYHRIIRAISAGAQVHIYGDGEQSRTNTFVADCASATATVAESPAFNDVFNISGFEAVKLIDAIRAIEAEVGREANIVYGPARPGDQRVTAGVIDKARGAFEYAPLTGFGEGIRRQVDWQIRGGGLS